MTGFPICRARRVKAIFGTQLFKFIEGGFLVRGEMTKMTFQPRFGVGRFWGRRADGGTLVLGSVHHVYCTSVKNVKDDWQSLFFVMAEQGSVYVSLPRGVSEETSELPPGRLPKLPIAQL